MRKKLVAEVFHGVHVGNEAIMININGGLCVAYVIDTQQPVGEVMREFFYKLKELQEMKYEIKYK